MIFQFGDFYGQPDSFIQDILTTSIGALIGALTAVFIFFKQLQHEKKKDALIEQNLIQNVFLLM